MNDYVTSLFDSYIPSAAETAVYQAFDYIATHSYDPTKDDYVSYNEHRLSLILNGAKTTAVGDDKITELLFNDLESWFGKIEKASYDYLNANTTIEIVPMCGHNGCDCGGEDVCESMKFSQETPWVVNITFKVKVMVNATLAHWDDERIITTGVSIIGLRDKLIFDNQGKFKSNPVHDEKIRIKNKVGIKFVDDHNWKISQITNLKFIQEARKDENKWVFFHYPKAPSYLDRLQGNYDATSECCGIISLVELDEEYADVDDAPSFSSADYCFYEKSKLNSNGCGSAIYNYEGFKLSDLQATYFNIVGLRKTTTGE